MLIIMKMINLYFFYVTVLDTIPDAPLPTMALDI